MNEERIADAAVQLCRRMAETDGQLHVAIIFDLGDPVASIYIGVAAAQQGRDLAPLEGGGEHRSLRDAGGCQTLSAQIGVDVGVLLADTDVSEGFPLMDTLRQFGDKVENPTQMGDSAVFSGAGKASIRRHRPTGCPWRSLSRQHDGIPRPIQEVWRQGPLRHAQRSPRPLFRSGASSQGAMLALPARKHQRSVARM